MAKRLKWLTLSPLASDNTSGAVGAEKSELPNDITFTIKKPFFTASVVLSYHFEASPPGASSSDQSKPTTKLIAHTSLEAKIPVVGKIHFSIQASSIDLGLLSGTQDFAFESCCERDEAKGNYRKTLASGNALTLESAKAGTRPEAKTRAIIVTPPSPLLVHVLALPALLASRENDTEIYVAQLVNGLKIQALRLDRIAVSSAKETYRGRIVSVPSELTEDEFRALSWENATSFEFDFDLAKNTIGAARVKLPIVGQIEIN